MFKRIHTLPKRWRRHAPLSKQSAKADYYYKQSRERFEKREDAFLGEKLLLTGRIGKYEGFSFYKT